MKKSFIIISTVIGAMSLMAFVVILKPGYKATEHNEEHREKSVNEEKIYMGELFGVKASVNFLYNIGSRYNATITKENLDRATSVGDILPEADWSAYPIQRVKVSLLENNSETSEFGSDLTLNDAQGVLLKSTGYSDNFRLTANCMGWNENSGITEMYDLNYFMTVVPEKEAKYTEGRDALIDYLKKNSAVAITGLLEEKLEAGRILFTVNTRGAVSNVRLSGSSGYHSVDETMMELLIKAPGSWEPATNSKGEKVEQVLMFSFGKLGC